MPFVSSENLHEPAEALSAETKDLHRAIVSLMEELEAVDWYQQRVEGATDDDLRAVLAHNRDEEIEHAMMNLEWIRRRYPKFDENARTYLFSEGPITNVEEATKEGGGVGEGENAASSATAKSPVPSKADGSLGIGSLKSL